MTPFKPGLLAFLLAIATTAGAQEDPIDPVEIPPEIWESEPGIVLPLMPFDRGGIYQAVPAVPATRLFIAANRQSFFVRADALLQTSVSQSTVRFDTVYAYDMARIQISGTSRIFHSEFVGGGAAAIEAIVALGFQSRLTIDCSAKKATLETWHKLTLEHRLKMAGEYAAAPEALAFFDAVCGY